MLYVLYVHLTNVKYIHNRQTHPLVRVNVAKRNLFVILKWLGAKTN
jgi:hypothetical protein